MKASGSIRARYGSNNGLVRQLESPKSRKERLGDAVYGVHEVRAKASRADTVKQASALLHSHLESIVTPIQQELSTATDPVQKLLLARNIATDMLYTSTITVDPFISIACFSQFSLSLIHI